MQPVNGGNVLVLDGRRLARAELHVGARDLTAQATGAALGCDLENVHRFFFPRPLLPPSRFSMNSSSGMAAMVIPAEPPRAPSSTDTREMVALSGASTIVTKSYGPRTAYCATTRAPIRPTSALTLRIQPGRSRSTLRPDSESVLSMTYKLTAGPPSMGVAARTRASIARDFRRFGAGGTCSANPCPVQVVSETVQPAGRARRRNGPFRRGTRLAPYPRHGGSAPRLRGPRRAPDARRLRHRHALGADGPAEHGTAGDADRDRRSRRGRARVPRRACVRPDPRLLHLAHRAARRPHGREDDEGGALYRRAALGPCPRDRRPRALPRGRRPPGDRRSLPRRQRRRRQIRRPQHPRHDPLERGERSLGGFRGA